MLRILSAFPAEPGMACELTDVQGTAATAWALGSAGSDTGLGPKAPKGAGVVLYIIIHIYIW